MRRLLIALVTLAAVTLSPMAPVAHAEERLQVHVLSDGTLNTPLRVNRFNASPEPVRKGRALTVRGRLQRLDAGTGRRVFGKRRVTVHFRAKGSKTWRRIGTVKTDRKGCFLKRFKAAKDGYWRVSFAGGPKYLASTSATDYVDVR